MRIINFTILIAVFALQTTFMYSTAIGAPISKTEKVTQFFAGDEGPRPAYYRIDSRVFSEEDAKAKLGFLKKQGFGWMETATEGDEVSFRDTAKNQWFAYNPRQSRYTYYSNTPVGQNDNIVDVNKLRSKANQYTSEFIGSDAKNFKYKNGEYEYQVIRGTPQRLVSVTFRYVRMLDNREVLGITNHFRIKLTNDGTVSFLDYTNPILVKTHEISSKIKRNSFNKYLDLYIKSDAFMKSKNGEPLPIKSVGVSDASSSYFSEKIGEQEYLSPHTSIESLIVADNGDTVRREFHMKDDPESVPGIQAGDILHYTSHSK